MIENGKISPSQFGLIIFLFALGNAVLIIPAMVASVAKQDAWLSLLLSIPVALAGAFLYNRLACRFPNETLIQYSQRILGRGLGRLVALFYILFFFLLSAFVLRDIGDFMTTVVLVQTPIDAIHAIFMVAVAYATACGLEVTARVGEVFFPWVIGMSVILLVLLLNQMDFSNLLPIMPQGAIQPVKGVYPLLGLPIFEYAVFLMFIPVVNRPKEAERWFYLAILLAGFFGILLMVAILAVLGADVTARSYFAIYETAKKVRLSDFLERMEAIIGGVWFITVYIKLVAVFYAANLALAQLFRLKDYRPLILPSAILVSALAIHIIPNTAYRNWYITEVWPVFSFIPGVAIPFLLLIIALLRGLRLP